MLSRLLAAAVTAAAAVSVGLAGPAAAQPPAPPPPPPPPFNVNALTPLSPASFAVLDGSWYAFGVPGGITCVLDRRNSGYGCSGPLPASPGGANTVSGFQAGPPVFTSAPRPPYDIAGEVAPLPANSRLSFRDLSCGTDGVSTACISGFDQTGFVLAPAGSYIVGAGGPPLLDRPEGTNPFVN